MAFEVFDAMFLDQFRFPFPVPLVRERHQWCALLAADCRRSAADGTRGRLVQAFMPLVLLRELERETTDVAEIVRMMHELDV